MPLEDDIIYSFNRNYSDLPPVNLPFKYIDPQFGEHKFANGGGHIQLYTNEQDLIRFYPAFNEVFEQRLTDTGALTGGLSASPFIDSYRYYFDFGDGTVSDNLTADHFYKLPGDYLVTLVCVDSATNFYRSLQVAKISAINVLPDEIYLTYTADNSAVASTFQNPILVTRYNSYQSWPAVSAENGYTINLAVSGNISPLVSP